MTDTPTSRMKLRQQSQGSNTNTWGDDKLNQGFRTIDRSAKGIQSLAITGDTTLSWANYSENNDGQVSVLIVTGSLSSPAALTMPSSEWQWDMIKNTTGQTLTVKTSAGVGVSIPNGRQVAVFCDGSDCYPAGANWLASYVTTLQNAGDVVVKTTLETAIANAAIPAAVGTILNSAADKTAGYLNAKVSATGTGPIAVTQSTTNPGANEVLSIVVAIASLALSDGGSQATNFAAAAATKYLVDTTGGNVTVTLPATPSAKDAVLLTKFGSGTMTLGLNGNKYAGNTSNPTALGEGSSLLIYTGASRGWVEM